MLTCMLRHVITSTAARAIAGMTGHAISASFLGAARSTERRMKRWATRHATTAAQKNSWAGRAGTGAGELSGECCGPKKADGRAESGQSANAFRDGCARPSILTHA